MALQWIPLALLKGAARRSDVASTRTSAVDGVKKPSHGPPPLPTMAPKRETTPVFQEGVDGDVESIPPSGRSPCAVPLDQAGSPPIAAPESARAAQITMPPTSLGDGWQDLEEEVEDPARTRRRRTARIGTAWGTALVLAAAAAAVVMSPRRDARSSAAPASAPPVVDTAKQPSSPAPIVAVSTAPVATPPGSAPAPASVAPCRAGMLPLAAGQATCVDVAASVLCARDRRSHALRPAGCIEAKTPKAACASRGARLATSGERRQLAAGKGRTAAGAFRCVAAS